MSQPIRCFVCDSGPEKIHIEAAGKLHSQSNIAICKTCGNTFHVVPTGPEAEAKMKDYYRHGYRPAPNIGNLLTTGNKTGYIKIWLDPLIAKMKKEINRPLISADIGCATGYVVAYMRKMGLRATGCDYTVTYRRFAEHFYGVPVTEELEPKHKYDLLTMYHVLEHIPEPDKKLAQYVGMLSDEGRMFISVPEWFDTLENGDGQEMAATGFDGYYHKDHVNIFSRQSLLNLFAKVGLVAEEEDHIQYGQTFVLRKYKPTTLLTSLPTQVPKQPIVPESWEAQLEKLTRSKAAIEAYQARDYKKAVHLWPKFPEAHLKLIMEVNGKDPDIQRELFEGIKDSLGDNMRIMRSLGVWCYQNQDYEGAIQVLEAVQECRPAADVWVWIGWCYREKGPQFYKKAMSAFFKAVEQDPRKWPDMMGAITALAHKLPSWDEVAAERAKEALFERSGYKPELVDHVMEPEKAKA